jgi:hypothetical protein
MDVGAATMREQIAAMKAIWRVRARISRRDRRLPEDEDLGEAGPASISAGHRRRCLAAHRPARDPLPRPGDRANGRLAVGSDTVLPIFDRWAGLIRRLGR